MSALATAPSGGVGWTDLLPALRDRATIMAIVNVTPDSFSDGGDAFNAGDALARALTLTNEGADILDLGGESTRPGSLEVDAEEELSRVLPALAAIRASLPRLPISIDTYKAPVAEAALRAGANAINDVWGLMRDPDIAHVAAAHGVPVVIMHWEPEANRARPLLDRVEAFFHRALDHAHKAGIRDDAIMLDPGIGFAKNQSENLLILRELKRFTALGYPLLVGASRKRFIGAITNADPKDRVAGSVAAHLLAVQKGAAMVRVHDVAAHRHALDVAQAIEDAGTHE